MTRSAQESAAIVWANSLSKVGALNDLLRVQTCDGALSERLGMLLKRLRVELANASTGGLEVDKVASGVLQLRGAIEQPNRTMHSSVRGEMLRHLSRLERNLPTSHAPLTGAGR